MKLIIRTAGRKSWFNSGPSAVRGGSKWSKSFLVLRVEPYTHNEGHQLRPSVVVLRFNFLIGVLLNDAVVHYDKEKELFCVEPVMSGTMKGRFSFWCFVLFCFFFFGLTLSYQLNLFKQSLQMWHLKSVEYFWCIAVWRGFFFQWLRTQSQIVWFPLHSVQLYFLVSKQHVSFVRGWLGWTWLLMTTRTASHSSD